LNAAEQLTRNLINASEIGECETRTLTIVLQHVGGHAIAFAPVVADALQEYIEDVRKGDAGASRYERHVTKNRCRLDVIASVTPQPESIADEDIGGDGIDALRERLLKLRQMARGLPGGPDAGAFADFAYSPNERAKDIRELINEQLAALGVADEPENDDAPRSERDDAGHGNAADLLGTR